MTTRDEVAVCRYAQDGSRHVRQNMGEGEPIMYVALGADGGEW